MHEKLRTINAGLHMLVPARICACGRASVCLYLSLSLRVSVSESMDMFYGWVDEIVFAK
jgi:hypothetical protein